jgi:hypothetical protein
VCFIVHKIISKLECVILTTLLLLVQKTPTKKKGTRALVGWKAEEKEWRPKGKWRGWASAVRRGRGGLGQTRLD